MNVVTESLKAGSSQQEVDCDEDIGSSRDDQDRTEECAADSSSADENINSPT